MEGATATSKEQTIIISLDDVVEKSSESGGGSNYTSSREERHYTNNSTTTSNGFHHHKKNNNGTYSNYYSRYNNRQTYNNGHYNNHHYNNNSGFHSSSSSNGYVYNNGYNNYNGRNYGNKRHYYNNYQNNFNNSSSQTPHHHHHTHSNHHHSNTHITTSNSNSTNSNANGYNPNGMPTLHYVPSVPNSGTSPSSTGSMSESNVSSKTYAIAHYYNGTTNGGSSSLSSSESPSPVSSVSQLSRPSSAVSLTESERSGEYGLHCEDGRLRSKDEDLGEGGGGGGGVSEEDEDEAVVQVEISSDIESEENEEECTTTTKTQFPSSSSSSSIPSVSVSTLFNRAPPPHTHTHSHTHPSSLLSSSSSISLSSSGTTTGLGGGGQRGGGGGSKGYYSYPPPAAYGGGEGGRPGSVPAYSYASSNGGGGSRGWINRSSSREFSFGDMFGVEGSYGMPSFFEGVLNHSLYPPHPPPHHTIYFPTPPPPPASINIGAGGVGLKEGGGGEESAFAHLLLGHKNRSVQIPGQYERYGTANGVRVSHGHGGGKSVPPHFQLISCFRASCYFDYQYTIKVDELLEKYQYFTEADRPSILPPPPPPGTDLRTFDLSDQIWTKFQANQQTPETYRKKLELWREMSEILLKFNSNYHLEMVGSTLSGFGSNSSDVDMCLLLSSSELDVRGEAIEVLESIWPRFEIISNLRKVELILAKVPILKMEEKVRGIDVDMNVNNAVGLRNTALLRSYSAADWRVRPLVLVVKLWAQCQGINDAKLMTLSSYSLALMVIHYLQVGVSPVVLPSLHKLSPGRYSNELSLEVVKEHIFDLYTENFKSENKQSLADLLIGFLEYYAVKFDYKNHAISVRFGSTVSKANCKERAAPKNDIHQWKHICIEEVGGQNFFEILEPFEFTNTARSVYDKDAFDRIRGCFISSWQRLLISKNLDTIFNPISPNEARAIGSRARS